jgi:hypothetical protein
MAGGSPTAQFGRGHVLIAGNRPESLFVLEYLAKQQGMFLVPYPGIPQAVEKGAPVLIAEMLELGQALYDWL